MNASPRTPQGPLSSPAISPMYRLQFEASQDSWVLLYPEGMVKLNAAAGEILRRCDGSRRVDQIVSDLQQTFSTPSVADDVRNFLEVAHANGWIA